MRTPFGRRRPRDEQGAVAVLTALLMVVLVLVAAVVVDLGNARDVRRQSQNAGDAASLAGANVLYPATGTCVSGTEPCITDAVAAVKSYAQTNFQVSAGDWTTCSAPAGSALAYVPSSTSCISFDSSTSPTLVRVYVPTRAVTTFFAGIIGSSSIPVGSSAQALVNKAVTCSLCFLGNMDAGNGDLTVIGGSIAVNGNVDVGPNSNWISSSNGIHGTMSGQPSDFQPAYTPIPAFGDPLASVALPLTTANLPVRTDPCGATTATGGTGRYSGALDVANNVTCTLLPGLYVISNTWTLGNHSFLLGTGVTLYVKGPNGYLHFKNGDAIFSAPLTAPLTGVPAANLVPAGYAIIYDRDNTNAVELQGNGTTSITGSVYAMASKLDFNGTTCFGFVGGPFVFGSGYTNGNTACVNVSGAISTTVIPEVIHLNK